MSVGMLFQAASEGPKAEHKLEMYEASTIFLLRTLTSISRSEVKLLKQDLVRVRLQSSWAIGRFCENNVGITRVTM